MSGPYMIGEHGPETVHIGVLANVIRLDPTRTVVFSLTELDVCGVHLFKFRGCSLGEEVHDFAAQHGMTSDGDGRHAWGDYWSGSFYTTDPRVAMLFKLTWCGA